jgi:hypothetical protein
MLSVYQHWDPLEVCAVGRSYPPEFYSFIKNPKVRSVMERIAIETEEDYQKLITLLESFGVKIIRNDISDNIEDHFWMGHYSPPPMTPRDHTIMIGNTFFMPGKNFGDGFLSTYHIELFEEVMYLKENLDISIKEKERLLTQIIKQIQYFPDHIKETFFDEIKSYFRSINHNPLTTFPNNKKFNTFSSIENFIKQSGNKIVYDVYVNAATTTRIGKDLYFGTVIRNESINYIRKHLKTVKKSISPDYRFHLIDVKTHSDAVYCPVKPGLIISLVDAPFFKNTFPDWEVVHLPNQSWSKVEPFLNLKEKNKGKWWVPGEELNDDFTDFVETWLKDWVLCVEETVFDVNMLIIDENNVICNNYNKEVFDAFERHKITPHIVNFRHRYFWDGGLHCITSDLSRKGTMRDYFPKNL